MLFILLLSLLSANRVIDIVFKNGVNKSFHSTDLKMIEDSPKLKRILSDTRIFSIYLPEVSYIEFEILNRAWYYKEDPCYIPPSQILLLLKLIDYFEFDNKRITKALNFISRNSFGSPRETFLDLIIDKNQFNLKELHFVLLMYKNSSILNKELKEDSRLIPKINLQSNIVESIDFKGFFANYIIIQDSNHFYRMMFLINLLTPDSIDLGNIELDDKKIELILENNFITKLKVNNCGLNGSQVLKLLTMPNLKELDISNNPIKNLDTTFYPERVNMNLEKLVGLNLNLKEYQRNFLATISDNDKYVFYY